MIGGLDANVLLDSVTIYPKPDENRFDVEISSKIRNEQISSGTLDQLVAHLPKLMKSMLKETSECFKLELRTEIEDSSWFTKATLSRFLCLVSAPELFKKADSIENEISQLEDARNFHLALYAKDHAKVSGDEPIEIGNSKREVSRPKVQSDASSDTTKNELLRAMDVRLSALKEELSASFARTLGSMPAADLISDLRSFCDYFGAFQIRDFLVKYVEPLPSAKNLIVARESAALAKMAQAERQTPSESENSDSSEVEKPSTERSRPLIRGPSSRRSASPMRRVQIGRSGARKPTALSIRSLTYIPPREKMLQKQSTSDGNSSCDEEPDQPPNRSESSVRRMSVQDAINLFERRQRDQSSDAAHSRRPSGEVLFCPNKPVLRRWSSGICQTNREELQSAALAVEETKTVPEIIPSNDAVQAQTSVPDASEWSKQKEAELNQMLMKFMETTKKPSKYGTTAAPPSEKRIDHSKPKEKISSSKMPTEKAIPPVRTAQSKANSKAEQSSQTLKPRRNSSPPVLSKKEAPKSTVSKKTAPLTRSLMVSSPSSKTVGTPRKPHGTPRAEGMPTSSKNGKSAFSESKKASPRMTEGRKPGSAIQTSKPKVPSRPNNEASAVTAKPRSHNKVPKKSTIVPLEAKPSKKVNSQANTGMPLEESESKDSREDSSAVEIREDSTVPEIVKLDQDLCVVNAETTEVVMSGKMEDEVKVISSAAWEEVDQGKVHELDVIDGCQMDRLDAVAEASSSSRARHSLSQMLQAESSESEVLEWGNAENPPAIVYQKDVPKGLKRLLKFGRRSKGDVNQSDRSSPSVLSDGEDDSSEVKGNAQEGQGLSAHSADRRSLREGQSNKATRSFFSLSSFRSRKSGVISSR